MTKNQSNDWLLQLSGKWTGKEIPTGNRVPEHQGGGVTNGDFGYPTPTTSVAPARHLQRTAPNQDNKKKKRKVQSFCLLQNSTNNRNRPVLFEIVDQYTESGAHY